MHHGFLEQARTGLLQGGGPVAQFNGEQMMENFKYDVLWYDLSRYGRQQIKNHRSLLAKVFFKQSGWKHAAVDILEHGLPKLQQPERRNDATAHINALGEFAHTLAAWLKVFASRMHAYRNTPEYRQHYADPMTATRKRKKALIH